MVIVGLVVLKNLPREDFPNIDFDVVNISTAFPGASPEQVERLVTNPIEKEVKGVFGIRDIFGTSTEGVSNIAIVIEPDYPDKDEVVTEVQRAVDRVQNLPPEITDRPLVQELKTSRNPKLQVNLSKAGEVGSDYEPDLELREMAKRLQRELEVVSGVGEVQLNEGNLEFIVNFSAEKLSRFGISVDEIVKAFREQNVAVPAGEIVKNDGAVRYRIESELTNLDRIQNVILRANIDGRVFRVKDLGDIRLDIQERQEYDRMKGRPSLSLGIVTKESADQIVIVDAVKERAQKFINQINQQLPENQQWEVSYGRDTSVFVRARLKALASSVMIGGIFVFLMLLLALNWRTALIVAIGIPFSFLGAVLLMPPLDFSLNLLTMFGFVVVLGMLVDDAIVVSESIFTELEKGKDKLSAAAEGTKKVFKPVLGSVMTTVLAFLPLVFMTGIFGKFVKFIPSIVILCLLVSLLEAFFLLPNHMRDFASVPNLNAKRRHPFERIRDRYRGLIVWAMRRRYFVGVSGIVFFLIALASYHFFGQFKLFPRDGVNTFFVIFEGKTELSLKDMAEKILPIELKLQEYPKTEVLSFSTKIGAIQTEGRESRRTGSNYAFITVDMVPEVDRSLDINQIADEIEAEAKKISGMDNVYVELAGAGPPVGRPVNIYFAHEDLDLLRKVKQDARGVLENMKGIKSIGDTDLLGKTQSIYEIDFKKAAQTGVNPSSLALGLQMAVDGALLGEIRSDVEKTSLRVKIDEDGIPEDSLKKMTVLTPFGERAPILSMMNAQDPSRGLYSVNHYQTRRVVTVYADLEEAEKVEGAMNKFKAFFKKFQKQPEEESKQVVRTAEEANKILAGYFDEWKAKYPGLEIEVLGENRDTAESFESLKQSLLLALAGVLFIVILTLGNIWQPFIVLITSIPMGLAGVIFVFILHDRPLSFLALFGVVGLVGVAVNVGIVLIDRINSLAKEMSYFDALMEGSVQRLRAVLLTSSTTVLGLMPTAYGWGGGDAFLKPMALALGWGIAFATIFGIILTPLSLGVVDDFVWFWKRLFKRDNLGGCLKAYWQALISGTPVRPDEPELSLKRLTELDRRYDRELRLVGSDSEPNS